MGTREITGRHVLLFTVGAFGIIIAVNVFMAFSAVSTFPGLETKNSFVASQEFEASRDAQESLGWTAETTFDDGVLTLGFTDESGRPVQVGELNAILGRATHVAEDRAPDFVWREGTYVAQEDLAPGNWNLRVVATADDGTEFRQRIVIYVN